MKKIFVLFICLLLQVPAFAATLPQGTPVTIQADREIDADRIKTGQTVNFSVLHPVKVNNTVLLKPGTEVTAQVLSKQNNFILGVPGELEVGNFQIRNSDGNIIRLRGSILDKGEGKYWVNIGWFFLFPILFVKGNDGKIPANIEHTFYTLEEVTLQTL